MINENNQKSGQNGYFHVVFCESIRSEADNKHTYVGVYPHEIKARSFPCQLPQLSVVATLVAPEDQVKNNCIEVTILAGNEKIGGINIEPEPAVNLNEQDRNELSALNLHIQGGRLNIKEPCAIKVRIKLGEVVFLSLNGLNVVLDDVGNTG